jgi:hypothetical protein
MDDEFPPFPCVDFVAEVQRRAAAKGVAVDPAPPREPAEVPGWDYLCDSTIMPRVPLATERWLRLRGEQGWELVAVAGDMAIFKRPLRD